MRPITAISLSSVLLMSLVSGQIITVRPSLPELSVWIYPDDYHKSGYDKTEDADLVTDDYLFDVSRVKRLSVNFNYTAGSLEIKAGTSKQIKGSIKYDPEEFLPSAQYDIFGSKGVFKVKMESLNSRHAYDDDTEGIDFKFGFRDIKNNKYSQEFDFQLPPDIPTDLKLEFALGDADIDLSNLAITSLELECGLSDVRLEVDEINATKCKEVYIESGLGDFNAYGLGLLRAEYVNLDVGLGSTYIDLSKQKSDLTGDIDVGLGSLELVLPKKANIKIRVDDSFLSSVDVDDMVKTGHKEWRTADWNKRWPTIEFDISIGLGSVDVDLVK
ncbi:MAG: hypothetical protein H8E14_12855 [Candidatus Marinimicrobia bacterium]|nr:hypothetical protein [Candidatus Neomarinimicrobiota bacterium]